MKKLLIIFILLQVGLVLASPPMPFPVFLTFHKDNITLPDFQVCFKQPITQEVKCEFTTKEGVLGWNLANFKQGYSNTDYINVTYCIDTPICEEKYYFIDTTTNQGGKIDTINVVEEKESIVLGYNLDCNIIPESYGYEVPVTTKSLTYKVIFNNTGDNTIPKLDINISITNPEDKVIFPTKLFNISDLDPNKIYEYIPLFEQNSSQLYNLDKKGTWKISAIIKSKDGENIRVTEINDKIVNNNRCDKQIDVRTISEYEDSKVQPVIPITLEPKDNTKRNLIGGLAISLFILSLTALFMGKYIWFIIFLILTIILPLLLRYCWYLFVGLIGS